MLFQRKTQRPPAKEYFTSRWDQRLYEALFNAPETSPRRTHPFSCVLTQHLEEFKLPTDPNPTHQFGGSFDLWLSEVEFCTVGVNLSFVTPHEYYDVVINPYPVGYMKFKWSEHDGRRRAGLTIALRNAEGRAESIARMFLGARMQGRAGLTANWSVPLAHLAGSDATALWGASDPFDDWRPSDQKPHLPGEALFSIEEMAFSS